MLQEVEGCVCVAPCGKLSAGGELFWPSLLCPEVGCVGLTGDSALSPGPVASSHQEMAALAMSFLVPGEQAVLVYSIPVEALLSHG